MRAVRARRSASLASVACAACVCAAHEHLAWLFVRGLASRQESDAGIGVGLPRRVSLGELDESPQREVTWFDAISEGDLEGAQQILERGSVSGVDAPDDEFDPTTGRGRTALQEAAFSGHVEIVEWLLDQNADIMHTDYWDGRTPLHEAAESGSRETVVVLLAAGAGAFVDQRCLSENASPLHVAASWGHREICELLLRAGADPTAQNAAGLTPGGLALEAGAQQLAEILGVPSDS